MDILLICWYFSGFHRRAVGGNQILILSPFLGYLDWLLLAQVRMCDSCKPNKHRLMTVYCGDKPFHVIHFAGWATGPFSLFISLCFDVFWENILSCPKNLQAKKNLILCLLLVRNKILNFLLISSKELFVQHISIQHEYAANIFSLN